MRFLASTCLALALAACSQPPGPAIAAELRIEAALSERVAALGVYVLGPKQTDGIFLTCPALMDNTGNRVAPDDPKVERLGHQEATFALDDSTVSLTEIAAGSHRLVYVAALDDENALLGEGCREDVTVESNATTSVSIFVYEYTGG